MNLKIRQEKDADYSSVHEVKRVVFGQNSEANLVDALRRNMHKMYGSPLSIISGSLKISLDELERLVASEFEKRKRQKYPA